MCCSDRFEYLQVQYRALLASHHHHHQNHPLQTMPGARHQCRPDSLQSAPTVPIAVTHPEKSQQFEASVREIRLQIVQPRPSSTPFSRHIKRHAAKRRHG
ncbi:hypothetical protein HDV57DRAFT_243547 [Trichoderma longibrachiatum]|uniref:Uncharacterized protein n=1 Tax=Trichoderma longibrachiatum ATCC 18648 TaxID=983965 RepID=A0A2T4C008_TRILO|nr:hypothetical protein M440DRAFT_1037982 [Trichoderma longibrachiatum ATCC 18648]